MRDNALQARYRQTLLEREPNPKTRLKAREWLEQTVLTKAVEALDQGQLPPVAVETVRPEKPWCEASYTAHAT